jgi:tRNA A37 threonylcarbamoyladenosine dehydratase
MNISNETERQDKTVDYSKQNKATSLTIPSVACIVGVGGTGAWVALISAMTGVKKIRLWDPLTVRPRNVAKEPYTTDQL